MTKHYDFVVLGGGSAGYAAAAAAREYTENVAIVDGSEELGGLCILRGCMPSKTLIYVAETLHHARHAGKLGLRIPVAEPDMKAVIARKKKIIADFAEYRQQGLTSDRFDLYRSHARFEDAHILVLADGTRLSGNRILVSTGSTIQFPAIPGLKEIEPWTSDDVLDLDFLPESVTVLGGGIVACELAQYLARMGTRVTMIQRSPHVLRGISTDAAEVVESVFRSEGIDLYTDTKLERLERQGETIVTRFIHKGEPRTVRTQFCLNALGRIASTDELDLEKAGVKRRQNRQIVTNEYQQTSIPHIYAAGDCAGPYEIVHIAVMQGELAARHAFGRNAEPLRYDHLLRVVFTDPQVADVGLDAETLEKENRPWVEASYSFDDHGRSILMEATHGYVKVLASPDDGRVLGAQIVGKDAGELIHAFSVAVTMGATVFDLLRTPWYHPTLSEIFTYPLEEIADKIRPIAPG